MILKKIKQNPLRIILPIVAVHAFVLIYAMGILKASQFRPIFWVILAIAIVSLFLPERMQRTFQGLFVFFTVGCVAWAILDTVIRPYFYSRLIQKIAYRPHEMFTQKTPRYPDLLRYKKNQSYEGVAYGDAAAITGNESYRQMRSVRFQSDHLGFRNDPSIHEKTIDTIVLGDSFFAGVGTTQDENLAGQLNRLGKVAYNLSIPGSPWHEYMNLGTTIDQLDIQKVATVFWGIYGGNDLIEAYEDYWEIEEATPSSPFRYLYYTYKIFMKSSPSRKMLERLKRRDHKTSLQVMDPAFLNGKHLLFLEYTEPTYEEVLKHPNLPKLEKTFQAMAVLAKEKNLKIYVLYLPTKNQIYSWVLDGTAPWSASSEPTGFSKAVEQVAQKNNFSFLDLTPGLVKASHEVYETSGEILWWYDDSHWNGKGYEVVASILNQQLSR